MTREEIQALIQEALIEEVARRVAVKLLERQKKALVIYTGATIGFAGALDNLKKLRESGFTFTVYLSESAEQILDVAAIRAALEPEALLTGQLGCPPEKFAMEYPTILVPAMTANTAAHLAVCTADTPAARMILNSMMRGKNVIVAIDGCCPDNAERLAKGYRMTSALHDRLHDNLETLRAYGASLTTGENLYEKTMRTILPRRTSVSKPAAQPQTAHTGGRVLSRGDVMKAQPHSVLRVAKGTLITQLARDEARARDVVILTQ